MVGFPERSDEGCFNSVNIVSPSGEVIHTYRKHFLYTTDENWASEGPSFEVVTLKVPIKGYGGEEQIVDFRICPAICMDLNPYKFEAPFNAYELGNFARKNDVHAVICSMAWLKPRPPEDEESQTDDEEEDKDVKASVRQMEYWATRLRPLWGTKSWLVICNRIGTEGDATYAGTSCVLKMAKIPAMKDFLGADDEILMTCGLTLRDPDDDDDDDFDDFDDDDFT